MSAPPPQDVRALREDWQSAGDLRMLSRPEPNPGASVGRGLTNDEIGTELFLSPATARTHVSHAMGKLGERDRAQLVVIAYETGLVGPQH